MLAGYWKETAEDLADDDPIPLACGQDVIFMVPDAELGREAGRAEVQPRDATSLCVGVRCFFFFLRGAQPISVSISLMAMMELPSRESITAAVAFLTPREQQGSFGRGPLQAVFEVGWAFDLEAHCLYHHHSGCSDSVDGQT